MNDKEIKAANSDKTLGQLLCEESDLFTLREMGINVPATRYVLIRGDEIEDMIISMGIDGVLCIYNMAEKGEIPEAEKIEKTYCANCDITFKGKNLISFLYRYIEISKEKDSPLLNMEKIKAVINPDNTYKLMCIDFS